MKEYCFTEYHCKYYSHFLTRYSLNEKDRLSMSLFNAAVDLNPHQIEAALFAVRSPLSKGVILADEVGLGKTIEAGLVLCQYWAERKRKILIITPASIRKQWALELESKFNLPVSVLDRNSFNNRQSDIQTFLKKEIIIVSFNFASMIKNDIKLIPWDLAVIDEAHKLRNSYRKSNVVGQNIKWATEGIKKLLITATPIQNSLLELYGLASMIDDCLFGDLTAFRAQFMNNSNIRELKERMIPFCKRTLRKQVIEYVNYTERKAITIPFNPTDSEQIFYEQISEFLTKEDLMSIPKKQKHLTQLIMRKLLASSSNAILGTLHLLQQRIELLKKKKVTDKSLLNSFITDDDIDNDLLDDILNSDDDDSFDTEESTIDLPAIDAESNLINALIKAGNQIGIDTKTKSLLSALEIGFRKMEENEAKQKAVIFTESRRTQEYLFEFLESNGYQDKVLMFNGSNKDKRANYIYSKWLNSNTHSGKVSGSRDIDIRTALVEAFSDDTMIMIATEAAAEGVNLQFCSLVINYDLPWNPQRIEQRIGRCHRYGQKHDVVVINFLNEKNAADKRVLELLSEKFELFDGVFGASDEVLGILESGVDFEKRIFNIYQGCRSKDEIEKAFQLLQSEMETAIKERMQDTQKLLIDNFDEDVHSRLKMQLESTKTILDFYSDKFWKISQFILEKDANFYDDSHRFLLHRTLGDKIFKGEYRLISKENAVGNEDPKTDHFLYRMSHPLGEIVIDLAKKLNSSPIELDFNITDHSNHIHVVEQLKGFSGFIQLIKLTIDTYEKEEHLIFTCFKKSGDIIDQETCEKLFLCEAKKGGGILIPEEVQTKLNLESERQVNASVSLSLERNNKFFNEAREKLEKWAEDMILSSEKALKDTKEQIKLLKRESRLATSLEEQTIIQHKIQNLEKLQRKQRQDIFKAEDEIMEKRDILIDQLEKRLSSKQEKEILFVAKWKVV